MDFIDELRIISSRIPDLKEKKLVITEEGTKNALVMPFIRALGYDVFNPLEVTPEYGADVSLTGTKKGEKVDYAIMRDGKPIILFECKCCGADLKAEYGSQLMRYFAASGVRFGILTDGVVYHFYADLEAPNKMDMKPFLVFDMLNFKDSQVDELKKFAKAAFNVEQILSTANELKYMNAIKKLINEQLSQPTDDFVKFFANQVYPGRMMPVVLAQFTEIVKRSWREVIADRMSETFKAAQAASTKTDTVETAPAPVNGAVAASEEKVVTTEEEQEGFRIVRAIVRELVDVKRVTLRDAQTYCAILLDDNNRRPICRMYFNSATKKYLGIFNDQKQEEKIPVQGVDDIYKHAAKLKAAVQSYIGTKKEG